jgi:FixJ family two-component response regulator
MFQPIDNQFLPDEPTVLAIGCDAATCLMLKAALRQFGLGIEWYASLDEFLEAWVSPRRGCVFLDWERVEAGLPEIVGRLSQRAVFLPVILLAPPGKRDDDVVAEATRAVRCGAFDFIPKPLPLERLAEAAAEALRWEAEHHAAIVDRARIERRLARLDEKEGQVLKLIVQGMPNTAISSLLELSLRTVEDRRKSLMAKMRAKSLVDLLRQAITAGVGTGSPAAGRIHAGAAAGDC